MTNGLRILNTRPLGQNQRLSQVIRSAGGQVIELPALYIEATANTWLATVPRHFSHAIFISSNAVHFFFNTYAQGTVAWPHSTQVIAVGQATAAALTAQGIRIDHLPSQADSEHLLALETLQHITHQTILLIKGEQGRDLITTTLRARGAQLCAVAVYRRQLPQYNQQYIDSLWREDAVDIILLTSEQTMHNLFRLFGPQAKNWLCRKCCVVISPRLALIAANLGIQTIIQSRYDDLESTLKGLIDDHQRK